MSFPTEPPIRERAKPWRFPDAERFTLSTGLEVELLNQPQIPVLHLQLSIRGGRWMAPPGVAGLMAGVSRHGTDRYDSAGLARRQDSLGARLSCASGQDRSQISAHGLSEHLDDLFELMTEVGLRPTFPEADVARERGQLAERRRAARSNPGALASEWLGRALYGEHPYGWTLPEPDALLGITREQLVAAHALARGRNNAALFVVGDVSAEALQAAAERALGGWTAEVALPDTPAPPPTRRGRRVILVDRPGSPQAKVSVGFQGIPRSDPDYVAARVMNQVLGGGVTSRLFMDLREARSLTYGCYAALDSGALAGDLAAGLSCAGEKLDEALGALFEHFDRIRDEAVPAAELTLAQDYLTGAFPNAGSTLAGLCGMLSSRWLHRLPDDIWIQYTGLIEAVTPADVQRAARRLIQPDNAVVVVVGEADALEAACARWGEVERRRADELAE